METEFVVGRSREAATGSCSRDSLYESISQYALYVKRSVAAPRLQTSAGASPVG